MSIRVYRGPHRDTGGPTFGFRTIPWFFFGLGFLGTLVWPIFPLDRKDSLTFFIIIFLFIATTAHAFIWWGMAWAATFLVVSLGISFSVLAINSATGFILGDISYTSRLGFQLLFVPFVTPLIWSSAVYIGIVVSRRISRAVAISPLTAAFASTGLLIALDGLFVRAGFHSWLTWIDQPALYGLSPLRAQIITFGIVLGIMVLTGQNSKNDRYSTRMPILAYSWIFVFTIFCARFLTDNFNNFLFAILVMGYVIIAFVYKTIKGN
jgi:uncharacterized membrane protein